MPDKEEITREHFSHCLKELMKGQKVTQQQLASYLGVTRQSISLYVEGKRNPDIHVLKKISEFFNISADYLLGLELYDEVKDVQTDLMMNARPLSIGLCKRFDESLIKTEKALEYSILRSDLYNVRMDLYEWLFLAISSMITDFDEIIEKLNGTFCIDYTPIRFTFEEVINEYQRLTSNMQEKNNNLLSLLCRFRKEYTEE